MRAALTPPSTLAASGLRSPASGSTRALQGRPNVPLGSRPHARRGRAERPRRYRRRGTRHEVDTIVWATGFRVTATVPMVWRVRGRDRSRTSPIRGGALSRTRAYLGSIDKASLPNRFLLVGPGTRAIATRPPASCARVAVPRYVLGVAAAAPRGGGHRRSCGRRAPPRCSTPSTRAQAGLPPTAVWNAGGCLEPRYYLPRERRIPHDVAVWLLPGGFRFGAPARSGPGRPRDAGPRRERARSGAASARRAATVW